MLILDNKMNQNFRKSIGRFDCKFIMDCAESTYFTFNRKYYESINYLLETESCEQSFNRSFSQIHIPGLNTPNFNENKKIFELYSGNKDCKLYHIKDCTVQIMKNFTNPDNLAGIFIVSLDKNKRTKAIKELEKILA